MGASREPKRRWAGVDACLRARHLSAGLRSSGILPCLLYSASWCRGDPTLPKDFLFRMAAVGTAPWYGVFPRQASCDIPLQVVVQDAEAPNARTRASLRPSKDDAFLLEQSLIRTLRIASAPSRCVAIAHGQGPTFRLIPRCVITESSGKQRIIDNADAGAQSALSSDPNKLVLCSPLRPALHAAAMLDCLDEAGLAEARGEDAVEGGGEDWPDTYRYCPMDRAASLCCVVAWWHATWGKPAFTGVSSTTTSTASSSTMGERRSTRLSPVAPPGL